MENPLVIIEKEVKLKDPVLIEGLPGLGLVGKIAAEHIISELKAKKFASLYSPDFPPQVTIKKDGTIKNMSTDFYYYDGGKQDLIIVVGDHQGMSPRSHYSIIDKILDVAEMQGVSQFITLGGYGIGRMVKEPAILGAATSKKIVHEYKKHGVEFRNVGGSIVGAAGLLLGMGMLKKFEGICLMCETHGQVADPKAAKKLIELLNTVLKLNVTTNRLEEQAKEAEESIKKLQEMVGMKQKLLQPEGMVNKESSPSYFR